MPVSLRRVTPDDVMPDAEFALQRRERRASLLPTKHLRRVSVGPHCTVYFESYETMLFQIQEMLLIEKGGAAQLQDELEAYNPLIPQGHELIATVMFELDDPVRRAQLLSGLGGIEETFRIRIANGYVRGVPEGDVERSRPDGKASSVHFLRFAFTPEQIAAFRDPAISAMIGSEDPRYPHMAILAGEARAELMRDFAN